MREFHEVASVGDFQNSDNMKDNTHLPVVKCEQDPLATYNMLLWMTQLHDGFTTSVFRDKKRKAIESESTINMDYDENIRQHKYLKLKDSMEISEKWDKKDHMEKIVRGTTYLFLPNEDSMDISFEKVQLSSVNISTTKYPTLSAIQTLQFQKTKRNMKGHACMICHHGRWKLFLSGILH